VLKVSRPQRSTSWRTSASLGRSVTAGAGEAAPLQPPRYLPTVVWSSLVQVPSRPAHDYVLHVGNGKLRLTSPPAAAGPKGGQGAQGVSAADLDCLEEDLATVYM
jgi:hypothetical protein